MKIALLPGDGIGPEIVAETVKVLKGLGEKFEFEEAPIGGAGYEANGRPLPEGHSPSRSKRTQCSGGDGVWKYDKLERALRPEQGILELRKELELYANLRPATCMGNSSVRPR